MVPPEGTELPPIIRETTTLEEATGHHRDSSGAEHDGMAKEEPENTHLEDSSAAARMRDATALDRIQEAALPRPISTRPIEMPELHPLAREYSFGEVKRFTLADKIRHYWSIIDTFTEQAVMSAEAILGPGTGADKKRFVAQKVMELLDTIEKRVNVIPDWIQPIVFRAFRFGVDMTIERVVKSFKARGSI